MDRKSVAGLLALGLVLGSSAWSSALATVLYEGTIVSAEVRNDSGPSRSLPIVGNDFEYLDTGYLIVPAYEDYSTIFNATFTSNGLFRLSDYPEYAPQVTINGSNLTIFLIAAGDVHADYVGYTKFNLRIMQSFYTDATSLVAPVPLPASLPLFGVGLLAICLVAKFRRITSQRNRSGRPA